MSDLVHNRAMATAPDLTGKMMGHGVYGRHSLAQHSAGGFGLPGLERAARAAAGFATTGGSVMVADLGAAGGRNELQPMTVAIETRSRRPTGGPSSRRGPSSYAPGPR